MPDPADRDSRDDGRGSHTIQHLLQPLRGWYNLARRYLVGNRLRRASHPTLPDALDAIVHRWGEGSAPAVSGPDQPIFIFGAGWRCGSTWLQRIVMSSGQALVWGEPFDRSGIVQSLSAQLLPIGRQWPPDPWFQSSKGPRELADEWVANLYPPVPALIDSHRALFRELFEAPARAWGIGRWGLKEVRLTTAHARYLRLLFPAAKFIFLVRSPFDAYESYRVGREPWYEVWPDRLIVTARQFGRVWSRLVEDFLQGHATVGGLLLRYEDLVSDPAAIRTVSEYLKLALSPAAAARSIRGNPHGKVSMSHVERWQLRHQVRELSRRLGYEG